MSTRRYVTLCAVLLLGLITVGATVHWFVGVQARHFGSEAAEAAVDRANQADFAESEWNKLRAILEDADIRAILEEKFESQCIDASWVLQQIIQNSYGQDDEQLGQILAELVPEPATPEECEAAQQEELEEAESDNSNSTTTTTAVLPDD